MHSRLDEPPSRPRPRDADVSRRAARRSAADRRAGTAPGRRICASSPSPVSDRDDARPARRAEPAGLPYRWSTRAILLDKTDATKLLTKIRRQWFAKRKSIAAILKEVMTNEASVLVDTDASNKAADADLALQELGADYAGIAYVTATVTVWDADPRIADEKLRLVEKVIQGRDFTAMAETINAVDAWLGSLPGHVYANVRQPPISTLNLAHMIPLSAVWAGPERDEHFAAPLLFGKTEGSTPFRFPFMSAMSAIR
jgi:type IV secretion system protein VirB4